MTVKNLLLLTFVFILSLTKAQIDLNDPKLLEGFDERAVIKRAKKESAAENKIQGYLKSVKNRYILEHHPELKHTHQEYHTGKATFINMTRQHNQQALSIYCTNLEFDSLDYSNWTGDIADFMESTGFSGYPVVSTWSGTGINGNNGSPVIINTNPSSTSATASSDRQVIMNKPIGAPTSNPASAFASGYDPVCQNPTTNLFDLPMVPSAGATSLRLGSEYADQTTQKIVYAISVGPQNTQFTYQFAVVLNDGVSAGHGAGDQPGFVFLLQDSVGNQIGGTCGQYIKDAGSASSNDTSFIKSIAPLAVNFNGDPIVYRKWHTATVDLTPYIGQTVYAEFQTLDCTGSIHFGYAYITATCGQLNAGVSGFCGGAGAAILNAPPGFSTYQWYGPNSSTNLITGADSSVHVANGVNLNDSFFVHMVTPTGCTTKLKVVIVASHIVAIPSSIASCKGGSNGSASVSVLGNGSNFSYSWLPAGHPNTPTISNLPAGTYTVHIVDNSGNCPIPKDTVVKVLTVAPPLTTQTSQLCGTLLSPPLTAPAASVGPYTWTMNTSTVSIGSSQVLTYGNPVAPSDFFIVTYKDPVSGCEDSLKTTLSQVTIDFAASPSPACKSGSNGSVVLSPIGTNTYTAFDWTINGGPIVNGTPNGGGPTLYDSLLAGGTYTFVINPTGNTSCTFSISSNVNQSGLTIPPPVTLKGCAFDTIHVVPAISPGSSNHWYQTSGSTSTPLSSSFFNASPLDLYGAMNTNGLIYTDSVYSPSPYFCVSVYKVTIKTSLINATITAPQTLKCNNDTNGSLKATANSEVNGPLGNPYTFTWIYPSPFASPPTIVKGITPPQSSQVTNLHAGVYSVQIKSGNCVTTKTISLVNPAPLNYDTLNLFYCPKDDSALIVATERGHPSYNWLLNHVVVPGAHNDSIWVNTSDVNNYVAAYLDGGCKDTAKVLITFPSWHALRPDTLANIFTPNGDHRNDMFFPFYGKKITEQDITRQAEEYHIQIYNRWGKLVFESDNYAIGWDGIEKGSGHPADEGSYFFVTKYKSNCSTKADIINKKGFVQLMR